MTYNSPQKPNVISTVQPPEAEDNGVASSPEPDIAQVGAMPDSTDHNSQSSGRHEP